MLEESKELTDAKPLLTIAIPTYNRAVYLRELLTVLHPQLISEPRIELIIADNASPDETPALVEEFQTRGLKLRSIRNPSNIGADGNFLLCFEQARGKYVWIFGDDDLIMPGGIARILALLTGKDYGLVYVTPFYFRDDYASAASSDRFGRVSEMVPDGLGFAQRVGAMIGFISSMIVNKEIYNATPHRELSELNGSSLMQLGYLFPVLASDSKHLIIWERLVAARTGNTSGWGICRVFGVNFKQIVETWLGHRIKVAKELQNATLRGWFPGVIMESRRGTLGPLETENMREVLESVYKSSWRYWVYIYPLLSMPLGLAEMWFAFVRSVDRARRLFLMARTSGRLA